MSEKQAHKRVIQGRVISKAGDKSIVILVERKVVHAKYRKIVKRFKKYTIHDENHSAKRVAKRRFSIYQIFLRLKRRHGRE